MEPYVNFDIELVKEDQGKNYLLIKWVVGGAKAVDETFIIYNFKRENDSFLDVEFESHFNSVKKENFNFFSYLTSKKYLKTELRNGIAIWDDKNKFSVFKEKIEIPSLSVNFSATILFKVDQVNY